MTEVNSCKDDAAYRTPFTSLNMEREKFLDLLNFNKNIVRAEGSWLVTDRGERLLDFTAQYGAVPFGHNPDFLWQALMAQQQAQPGIMIQPFQASAAKQLAQRLIALAPGNMTQVTLGCTGAEAVEMALKMARAKTGRADIVSTINSFHGKTMGALLATGNAHYRSPFHCASSAFHYIPYNNLAALEAQLRDRKIAAFIVEPIQGEGGMVQPAPGYLKQCEHLCRRYGTLLIVDEIQVGLGRTGSLFACEHEQVEPDILLLAKALGGGMLPISACLANDRAWCATFGQRHSATFANNQLSATVALQVLDKLTQDVGILANVRQQGEHLKAHLQALVARYPSVWASTSGTGLMQGLSLAPWLDEDSYFSVIASEEGYAVALVAGYLLNRHSIFTAPTLNTNNVLRIQPSLLIQQEHIDRLMGALEEVSQRLERQDYRALFRSAAGLLPGPPVQPKKRAPRSAKTGKRGTFAFFIHPTCRADTLRCIPGGTQAYSRSELGEIERWIDTLKSLNDGASPAHYIPEVASPHGGYVDGWLISSLLTPAEMLRLDAKGKQQLLDSYLTAARSKQATMIGLGAFTSIISKAGTRLAECGIPVTTGNAYTALTSTQSLRHVCQQQGRIMANLRLGIVGASGSVGRLAALDLGPECRALSLLSHSNTRRLEAVAGEVLVETLCGNKAQPNLPLATSLAEGGVSAQSLGLNDHDFRDENTFRQIFHRAQQQFTRPERFPILLSHAVDLDLPACDLVLTATSQGEGFIQPHMLAPHALVCDVARPSDLTQEVASQRSDVLAYEGGLVHLPAALRFGGANVVGLETGISLACLSETIILAQAQVRQHYSLGGASSLAEARQVYALGQLHGFSPCLPKLHLPANNLQTG